MLHIGLYSQCEDMLHCVCSPAVPDPRETDQITGEIRSFSPQSGGRSREHHQADSPAKCQNSTDVWLVISSGCVSVFEIIDG